MFLLREARRPSGFRLLIKVCVLGQMSVRTDYVVGT